MPERTATGPNGEKLVLREGKWVPLETTAAPSALPKMPTEEAAQQDRQIRIGMRTGIGAFLANILSIPHASGELVAAGAALPALMPGGKTYSEARKEQEQAFPAAALMAIPDVSTSEVLALPSAFGRAFGNANANAARALTLMRDPNAIVPSMGSVSVPHNFRQAVAEEDRIAADNPVASSAGQTAGDIASMLTLRPGQRAAKALGLGPFNPRANVNDVKGALDAAARTLARGMGRTAEAGFDGAVLGALSDGDPVKTAAWSAGIQAGGSMALTAKNSFFRNPLKSFAALYLGHEMWKAVAPGPQDFFDSKDTAVTELVAAYGLGTAAAMAGATRGVGSGAIRDVTDAMSTASRTTISSVVSQLQEAAANKQTQYARVLEMLAADQDLFGSAIRQRIEQAAASEKPRALLNEIDSLMSNTRFRDIYERAEANAFGSDIRQMGAAANGLGQRQRGMGKGF